MAFWPEDHKRRGFSWQQQIKQFKRKVSNYSACKILCGGICKSGFEFSTFDTDAHIFLNFHNLTGIILLVEAWGF